MTVSNRTLRNTPTLYFETSAGNPFATEVDVYADLFDAAARFCREHLRSGVIVSIMFDYADFPNNAALAVTFDDPEFV